MDAHLSRLGLDTSSIRERARSKTRKRARSESRSDSLAIARAESQGGGLRASSAGRDRSMSGLRNVRQKLEADKQRMITQRRSNLMARSGESDRAIHVKMPKHLFSGKRGNGTSNHR